MPEPDPIVDFQPMSVGQLERILRPITSLVSPVFVGLENIPRSGAVLLVGNHTVYGCLDAPMMGLGVYKHTGRYIRGLADNAHYQIPGWRDVISRMGGIRGTRENCARLFEAGEAVTVFPGGGREVNRRKGEAYTLIWKQRIGFARMAIAHSVPIVPFSAVGVDDMFDIIVDANDVLGSPLGVALKRLGVTDQEWFRNGEVIPPLSRGKGPGGLFRAERQYFRFAPPIDTARYEGMAEDRDACFKLRDEVQQSIERGLRELKAQQQRDPDRFLLPRLFRRATCRPTESDVD